MISINGQEVKFEMFPNGETRVNGKQIKELTNDNKNVSVKFNYASDASLIKLMFVKRHLDNLGKTVGLVISYMPYSRMDRKEGDSVFTLKYVSEFINSLNFEEVVVIEPHSDVTMALLDKSYDVYPTETLLDKAIADMGFDRENDYIFFPDNGASKRYGKFIKGYKELVGFKKRNFQTGKIESLQVIGDQELSGKKVIIVDDLSSYGGTFLHSGRKLKEIGAAEIYLVVGHCENSIFKGELLKDDSPIDMIYTTDSILTLGNPKIKTFKVE